MAVTPPRTPPRPRPRPDVTALALAPLGIAIVFLSQIANGVPLLALLQLEAALIVIGGTLGALCLTYSPAELMTAIRAAGSTFMSARADLDAVAATMIGMASRGHRRGLVTLEAELDSVADPFLREGVRHAIDEPSADAVRGLLNVEAAALLSDEEAPARIFEAAAGYAPTLGILGAVLGLIDVMRHLSAPSALGGGIAVAFVSTVYGVGLANLVLLPLAGRLRERAAQAARRREMMTHGICAIHQRVHPRALAHTLRAYGAKVAEDRAARLLRSDQGRRLPA
ncbi:MAG TPA: MotA/TolQ/ExbB proton channel family protein [Vicinamibacterales bacterium]|nr:MotA/TolQ/ExbB proton channel family protein [Vicinamibacterales bacterium]